MLLARSDDTIPPNVVEMEVLNVYGGVVKDGVGKRKLGRVVATVCELADIKESTASGVSVWVMLVLFWIG